MERTERIFLAAQQRTLVVVQFFQPQGKACSRHRQTPFGRIEAVARHGLHEPQRQSAMRRERQLPLRMVDQIDAYPVDPLDLHHGFQEQVERRLEVAGGVERGGQVALYPQHFLGLAQFADVGQQRHGAGEMPLGIKDGPRRDEHRNRRLVLAEQLRFVRARLTLTTPGHLFVEDLSIGRAIQGFHGATEDLFAGVPQQLAEAIVDVDRLAGNVHHGQRLVHRLHDQAVARLPLPARRVLAALRPFAAIRRSNKLPHLRDFAQDLLSGLF